MSTTEDTLAELADRARDLWPDDPYLQAEWMRAVRVRDALLGMTTRYLGLDSSDRALPVCE